MSNHSIFFIISQFLFCADASMSVLETWSTCPSVPIGVWFSPEWGQKNPPRTRKQVYQAACEMRERCLLSGWCQVEEEGKVTTGTQIIRVDKCLGIMIRKTLLQMRQNAPVLGWMPSFYIVKSRGFRQRFALWI